MLRYALTLIQGDRAERGLAVVDSAMASGASDAEAHYARGLALRKLERMRESRTELEAALHEDPDFEPALQLVSLGRLHRGDVEGAYPLLRHLADLRPTDAEVNFNAGLAAQKLGHREAALDLLRNFLELAPNDRRRSAVQKLVDELAQGG
jgi:tetratricopeptide (TPR) repeat protein